MHVSWQRVPENKGIFPWGLSGSCVLAFRSAAEQQRGQVDASVPSRDRARGRVGAPRAGTAHGGQDKQRC